jgi:hypothetical protein
VDSPAQTKHCNVLTVEKGATSEIILLQCSSAPNPKDRYLFGIIESALPHVDKLVLWFDDRQAFLAVSAAEVIETLKMCRDNGVALGFSGDCDRQCRANVYFRRKTLDPQGALREWPVYLAEYQ